jgi:DnaJ family protein C protein 19
MARFIIFIAIAAIGLILWYKITRSKGEQRKKLMFWSLIGIVVAVLSILAVTGHLNIITAAIAGAVAFIPRLLQYSRYLPLVRNLYQKHATADTQTQTPAKPGKQKMTVNEAIEILALEPDYTEADVIAAHRRIMQKVHPDRGGSDFLAAQINQAKEVLLA